MSKLGAVLVFMLASSGLAVAQPGAVPLSEPAAASVPGPDGDRQLPPPPQADPPVSPQASDPGAPPAGSTAATFVSTTAQPWEVLVDRNPACQTPCSIYVPPMRFVTLRSFERSPVLLDVGMLPPGAVVVEGKPLQSGKYAAGITFTALSGMALATGVALTAVGCSTDRDGMCTAGLITGGTGAVGLYLSIQLMRAAVPKVRVLPGQPYVSGNQVGLAGTF